MKIKKTTKNFWRNSALTAGILFTIGSLSMSCSGREGFDRRDKQTDSFNNNIEKLVTHQENQNNILVSLKVEEQKTKVTNLEASLMTLEKKRESLQTQLQERQKSLETLITDAENKDLQESQMLNSQEVLDAIKSLGVLSEEFEESVLRFVEAKDLNQIEEELNMIAQELEEAKLGQATALFSEFLLYVFGFKWLWGIFSGYKSTFMAAADEKLQQMYAILGGKNITRQQAQVDLLKHNTQVQERGLRLEQFLRDLIRDKIFEEQQLQDIIAKINLWRNQVGASIDFHFENHFRQFDKTRDFVERIPETIQKAIMDLESFNLQNGSKLVNLLKEAIDLFAELIKNIRLLGNFEDIERTTFKEGSTYPLNFFTTRFGMTELGSYQENSLKGFRKWKLQTLQQKGIVVARIKALESQIQQNIDYLKGDVLFRNAQEVVESSDLLITKQTEEALELIDVAQEEEGQELQLTQSQPQISELSLNSSQLEEESQLDTFKLQPQLYKSENAIFEEGVKNLLAGIKIVVNQFVANSRVKLLKEVSREFSQEIKELKAPISDLLNKKLEEIVAKNQDLNLNNQKFAKFVEQKRALERELESLVSQVKELDTKEATLKEELEKENKYLTSLKELQSALKSGRLLN